MGESAEEIASDISAVGRIGAVPTLLRVLCENTGMGFAAVARVSDESWTLCAVVDDIQFGLGVGGQLPVKSTLCSESRAALAPIIIDHASTDPVYASHHTPRIYKIESYVSVPIVLANGRYFGNLCAIDPRPAAVKEPRIVSLFSRFAEIIALQLDGELKREEEKAALLDERATHELREQFIAVLGHDLRNPLQAVFASGELLERKLTDPVLLNIAKRIKVSARRMSGMINDVLDLARGRLGSGIGIALEDVDSIETSLSSVVIELQDAQPDRRIVSSFDVEHTVRCDIGRIQQLASNLLANALTHGAATTPVEMAVRTTATDFELQVRNGGEPIHADNIGKIFEPFWRSENADSRQGLGLGLYICAQIVTAHGGQLTVESTHDAGTRFTARIPLAGCAA